MTYDYIFVGAGPAGLTGAICAARLGKRCLVLEKKSSLASHPRGETLRYRPVIDEILGEGGMASAQLTQTSLMEYYAPEPDGVDKISVTMKEQNIVFDWARWMQAFNRQADSLGIEIRMGAQVDDILETPDRVTGVVYSEGEGKTVHVSGDVIFACDGHKSRVGQQAGVGYESLNYPIVKALYRNAAVDTPGFKFFIVPEGVMDGQPDFPPAILFLFPRDGKNCEAGIMVMTGAAGTLPTGPELLDVWKRAAATYPVLRDMLKHATLDLLEATMIPMKGPMENVIPKKGLVLLGDAAGFVEVQGGSGLVSSMECAKFWVHRIAEAEGQGDLWADETIRNMIQAYNESGIFQHIKKNAQRSHEHFEMLFGGLRTHEEIMKHWDMLKSVLEHSLKEL